MVDVRSLHDIWYVPCEVNMDDAMELDLILTPYQIHDRYVVEMSEGDFLFNENPKFVKVLKRCEPTGDTDIEYYLSKYRSDFGVMLILKCAELLGYKIILENKYSN